MCLNKNEYAIYPSNWLMRAGIVGFLRILDDNSTNTYNNYIENGTLNFNFDLSDFFTIYFKYVKNNKINLKFFYNNSKVANNAPKDSNKNKDLNAIKEYFQGKTDDNELLCTFCNERKAIKRDNKYVILDEVHFTPLGASPSNLANFFWEGEPNLFMCLPCELIIYCAAFGFTQFNGKYYFIDAPANIKEIKEINDIWKDWLNSNSSEATLKNSFIEILKKTEKMKAKWSLQNISIIEINPVSSNTSNIYNLSISPEIAYAIRKRI